MNGTTWINGKACVILAALVLSASSRTASAGDAATALRPPSVPLVACDPYFSIWSPADKLTDADTVHWTGKPHRLTSLVRIDGKAFRLMGREPADVPALPQTGLEVLPTRTIYTFEGEGARVTLTFMTAALPDDLMVYSRPVTYLTWESQATDGKEHDMWSYFRCLWRKSPSTCPSQEVSLHAQENIGDLGGLRRSARASSRSLPRKGTTCGLIGDIFMWRAESAEFGWRCD